MWIISNNPMPTQQRQEVIFMNLHKASFIIYPLIEKYGLVQKGWKYEYRLLKRFHGLCYEQQKVIAISIAFIRQLADNSVGENEVRDLILHEIAHALVGNRHGHNEIWKAKCVEIGARPERCSAIVVKVEAKWRAICQSCKQVFEWHRRPRILTSRYCLKCGTIQGKLHISEIV